MFTPPDNDIQADDRQQIEEDFSNADIHTMPDKFQSQQPLPQKKGGRRFIFLGIVIFLALGGVIAAGVIFLSSQTPEEEPIVQLNQDQNINANQDQNANVNENVNNNANQNVNQDDNEENLDTPVQRDLKRLEDIHNLRTALIVYFNSYDKFPFNLNSLSGNSLSEIPKDPLTGENYLYLAGDDQTDYKLYFTLETQASWQTLILPAGDYYLDKQGIAPDTETGSEEEIVDEPVVPPPVFDKPTLGLDSDGDQLTDIEENIHYGTNASLADTDGDGYTDAVEILNFYDPTDPSGRLINSGLTALYTNNSFNYNVVYPTTWVVRPFDETNRDVIFTSNTGEFINITVQENPLGLSSLNWYLNQKSNADASELTDLTIDGLPAVQTPDGLMTYLAVGSKLYTLAYNISSQQQMNFNTTYQLFLRSFMFNDPAQE